MRMTKKTDRAPVTAEAWRLRVRIPTRRAVILMQMVGGVRCQIPGMPVFPVQGTWGMRSLRQKHLPRQGG
jgi:hypothetical protein